MARVTINDIARLSGFSKTSVSFAFNDPSRISDATRDKILGIATELGYVPDPSARSLSLRRHGTIGLLLPQIIPVAFLNPYLSQIVQGIGDICGERGFSLTLIPPVHESIVEGVRSAAVDGLITLGLEPGMEVVDIIRRRNLPFVTIDARGAEPLAASLGASGGCDDGEPVGTDPFPVISVDDRTAAAHVMRYVLSLGHRRIAILRFPDEPDRSDSGVNGYTYVTCERLAGYREALDAHDVSEEAVPILACESSLEGGEEAVGSLLDMGRLPTAIVAMSDIMAIGAMRALERAGFAVPDDISVAGFDDIPESRIVNPGLTTVSQPGFEKGRTAAQVLTAMIDSEPIQARYVLTSRLRLRGSCAVPKSRAVPTPT